MIYITDSFCGKFSYLYTPWTFSLTKFLHGVLRMFQSIEKSVRWVTFIMSMLVFMFMAHAHHLLWLSRDTVNALLWLSHDYYSECISWLLQWMHCCGYLNSSTQARIQEYISRGAVYWRWVTGCLLDTIL